MNAMTSKQIVILIVLIGYMAANMILGLRFSRMEKGQKTGSFLQSYFIGGRSMGGLVLAMTLVATYTSASSFLGGPGLAASWGLTVLGCCHSDRNSIPYSGCYPVKRYHLFPE